MHRRILSRVKIFAAIAIAIIVASQPTPAAAVIEQKAKLFPLAQVKLLDGPFKHAQDLNLRYVLAHDVDRFVAPFRKEAGLEPRAAFYPNWESQGLAGHVGGHYLTALAQLRADTGDAEVKRRLDYMVAELADCQKANGDGYIGGVPNGKALWAEIAAGQLRPRPFDLNGRWVPWYNMHKTFAGLRDAHVIGGNAQARDVFVKLCDWCGALMGKLSDEQMQSMMRTEQGGMPEVLADAYAITGDKKYLALAKRFSDRAILDPLLAKQDKLEGLHANTQIPKVIGFARIGQLADDPAGIDAARFFWDLVVGRNTVAIGGNSSSEHFHATNNYSTLLESHEGLETCNSYNMLRLTEPLFALEPSGQLADYYERTLLNHILSSQHPQHGGLVYFTPMRPRHYRVYSKPNECFWCCVGTGIESHSKHARFIYAAGENDLYVNLFIASELNWAERGVKVRQETTFPDAESTKLTMSTDGPKRFTLQVRQPGWVPAEMFAIHVNGERVTTKAAANSYVGVHREWKNGDRVEITLPMPNKLERLPDGSNFVALLHGPIVLAAAVGNHDMKGLIAGSGRNEHSAPGPKLPPEEAPTLVGSDAAVLSAMKPVPERPLMFKAPSAIRPAASSELELIPFSRLHDTRYMIYWKLEKPGE
jgi:uncharacterized protein